MRLALAPAVWLVHFTAVYALATLACERLAPGVVAATALALAVFFVAGLVDYRRWRARGGEGDFVARINVLLCALSALATLWVAFPAFVLPPCAA